MTETFWLIRAEITYLGGTHDGYIYYPRPSSVKSHTDDVIEVLAPKIHGLTYGDKIRIFVLKEKITFKRKMPA